MNLSKNYVDDGMAIKEPHHSRTWISGDTTAESSPFTFHDLSIFRFQRKHWLFFSLFSIRQLIRNSIQFEYFN